MGDQVLITRIYESSLAQAHTAIQCTAEGCCPSLDSLMVVKVLTPVQSQMGITGLGSSHKSLNSVDIVFHFTAAYQRDAYWKLRCVPSLTVVVYHGNGSQSLC